MLSFSLEDDDARAGSKKERVFSMPQKKEKREKREKKRGKQDLIGQRAPSLRERFPSSLEEKSTFFSLFCPPFSFSCQNSSTNSSSSRESVSSSKDHRRRRVHSLSHTTEERTP